MNPIQFVEEKFSKKEPLPSFQVGDTLDVHVNITEGEKERVQIFSGTVIKIKGGRGHRGTFTVRRIVAGEGVERVFPFHSLRVETVKVKRLGKVRRAKLYYLRERVGKATKVKERIQENPNKGKGRRKSKAAKKTPPKPTDGADGAKAEEAEQAVV